MTTAVAPRPVQLPSVFASALQGARAWARTFSLNVYTISGDSTAVQNRRLALAADAIEAAVYEIVDRRGRSGRRGRSMRQLGFHRFSPNRDAVQTANPASLDVQVRQALAEMVANGNGITTLRQIKRFVLTGELV